MTDTGSLIIELIASLFDSILFVYFIVRYNRATLKTSWWTIPPILLLFAVTLVGHFLLPGFSTAISMVLFLIATLFSLRISSQNKLRAILASCIYEITFVLLSSLLYIGISMIINDFDQLMQGSTGIVRFIYIFLHKVALFTVLQFILHVFRSDEAMNIWNGILTFLLSISTIFGLGATMYIVATPAVAVQFQLQIFIIVLAFILANVFLYLLLYQVQRLQKNRYELKFLQEKMAFEEARHNDALAVWDNVRKVQHDMKQHLTIISSYLGQDQGETCQAYIQSLLPQIDHVGKLIQSDNAILDYLINSKLSSLKNTQVIISGTIGDLSDIRDADLACLIGNILDNAIEAIEKVEEKRIELLFSKQNNNRIIICKNTVKESVLKNNPSLCSTKNDRDSHGWGHQIVEKIVSDYHGMIDYFEEFGMFGVQIIIPEHSNKNR